jgi:glycosyltransferase involved in cell wall biosynthesis
MKTMPINVAHITSSFFFGGPERQMLGLADELVGDVNTIFISFAEKGLCQSFIKQVDRAGYEGFPLTNDTPWLRAACRELTALLHEKKIDLICCHGYKADILGLFASRRLQIPNVAISRGWTHMTARVRLYEALDRRFLRWMDRVVCVSNGQARKVLDARVREERVSVIHNAVSANRFTEPDPVFGARLRSWFPHSPRRIIGAAGRLSPEKGFDVLVNAAADVCEKKSDASFVLFGDGPMKTALADQIGRLGLEDRFLLPGFTHELDCYLPHFDVFTQSSHTEGMPNVILEAFAAGVPVVATAVGGTPEIVEHGRNGFLVPPGDPSTLANRILETFEIGNRREEMTACGRQTVLNRFSFQQQARQYLELFESLVPFDRNTIQKRGAIRSHSPA